MTSPLAEELRTTFLFEHLTDDQLAWLVERGEVCTYDRGAHVYDEGEPGAHFYVLLDGGVRFTRRVGADVVELPGTTQRGVYAGATQSIIGSGGDTYLNSLLTTRRHGSSGCRPGSTRPSCSAGSRWPCTCSRGCSSACATARR